MSPKLPQELDRISQLVQKIRQTQNLLEFEAIDLPFKLGQTSAQLWGTIFPPEVLQQLGNSDAEALDAWAIALTQTLETQLAILNSWLPYLATLPSPPLLNQKISDSIQAIGQIAKEKYQLLQTSANLLSQEEKLRHDQDELDCLQQKVRELEAIQTQLQTNNLEDLRREVAEKSRALEPETQVLRSLQQQQAELEAQISALKQQQDVLDNELTRLRSHQQRWEASTTHTAQELITLTQLQREKLSEATASVVADLEKQRAEYHQIWEQLQAAIQAFNQYQTETDEIRSNLETHYYSDQRIAQQLPVDRQRVDTLLQTIQENLAELDRELAAARSKHEQSQQKQSITF